MTEQETANYAVSKGMSRSILDELAAMIFSSYKTQILHVQINFFNYFFKGAKFRKLSFELIFGDFAEQRKFSISTNLTPDGFSFASSFKFVLELSDDFQTNEHLFIQDLRQWRSFKFNPLKSTLEERSEISKFLEIRWLIFSKNKP